MSRQRLPRLLLFALALLGGVATTRAQTLVAAGDNFRYFKGRSEPSSPVDAWRQIAFDDSTWLRGPTGIGYGDGDDATVLADMAGNYVSVYMRRTFTVADPTTVRGLLLTMSYDDGFVAYLN